MSQLQAVYAEGACVYRLALSVSRVIEIANTFSTSPAKVQIHLEHQVDV
jgi:hypothetical protein